MVNKSCATPTTTFVPRDFTYDAVAPTCVCPAGKSLYRKDQLRIVNGYTSEQFRGTLGDCGACPLRARCLRTPDTTRVRNVAFMRERVVPKLVTAATRMNAMIDTAVRAPLRSRGAGVRGSAAQQTAGSVHAARPSEGRGAVAARLPGAQTSRNSSTTVTRRRATPGGGVSRRVSNRSHSDDSQTQYPQSR